MEIIKLKNSITENNLTSTMNMTKYRINEIKEKTIETTDSE